MNNLNTSEEVTPIKDRITALEEAEAKLIEDFNTEWLEHGLGFD